MFIRQDFESLAVQSIPKTLRIDASIRRFILLYNGMHSDYYRLVYHYNVRTIWGGPICVKGISFRLYTEYTTLSGQAEPQ